MKIGIINEKGGKEKEIEMPKCFSSRIREDISQKVFEAEKRQQPFAPYYMAGRQHSASGKIKHSRKVWKTGYGHGISRVPRKVLWRRGNQFNWIGAEVVTARGGRRAHPPRVEHFLKEKKINRKEENIAIVSALSSSCLASYLKKRYSSLDKINIDLPLVINSSFLELKTKEFYSSLKKILGHLYQLASNKNKAGLLLIIGKNENFKINGIEVKKTDELAVADFWPFARLTIYTENAVKELGEKLEK